MVKRAKAKEIQEDFIDEEPPAEIGDNKPPQVGGIAQEQMMSIITRVEKLMEEKQAIQGDISDVFREAKGNGFDVPTLRFIIKERQLAASERDERDAVRHAYMHAAGLLPEYEHGAED